jgi:hypothetical protein
MFHCQALQCWCGALRNWQTLYYPQYDICKLRLVVQYVIKFANIYLDVHCIISSVVKYVLF